jgi:hypothetical protein
LFVFLLPRLFSVTFHRLLGSVGWDSES